jgi:hypothetical protein
VSDLSNASDSLRSARRQGFARCARPLTPPLTAAVAAAGQVIMQSHGRLPRCAAIHDPKPSAAAGAAAEATPNIFSLANGTLSAKVCSGVLP